MQIISKRVTGDGESNDVYVQQIVVSGLNDTALSDACDNAFETFRALGLNVQFRDDSIPDEVRNRLVTKLFATEEVTES